MNPVLALPSRFFGLTPTQATILVIVLVTAFRFFYCTWLPLLPDETYYFQWSRPGHLDASYFSKGPAVAYTIAAGTTLFGANNFGVRFFAVMLSAGTAWQMFLLARRWYDDVTGLIAVLITNVVPIYALGAVVMTIDPLSAFFWIWAANLFSRAIQEDRLRNWLLTGFAVGCGFLAKYLNALELVAFLAFLLLIPKRRVLLKKTNFWFMLAMAVFCTTPVLWWNAEHGWVTFDALMHRGHLNHGAPFVISFSTFAIFIGMQALVVSPLLFLSLLLTAIVVILQWRRNKTAKKNEGDLLLLVLFLSVFLMYAVLAWHLPCEANWPAVSYLSLIVLMAAQWRRMVATRTSGQPFIVMTYALAWLQTLLVHDTEILHLPSRMDPMRRVSGWAEIAGHLNDLRQQQHADVLLADGYKEASAFSFYLPDKPFVYALRHEPPSTQFDFWPTYPTDAPHRVLWISDGDSIAPVRVQFNTITFVEHIIFSFNGEAYREYSVFLCENKNSP
jgi:4-amino-4-deoxy-L-arabinose transferase-like glycosyltransferase